jgi:ribose-phosphate pyrophosphokinase
MSLYGKDIKIFSGNSNRSLATEITEKLGIPLGVARVEKFSDGESLVNITEGVRGSDVFVVQSTCTPVNDNIMELLIMIDALKRASASRVTAVIPYFGYARQDRKAKARDPISAKLVANLLTKAGADRILTMDLHASQIQGFFDIPVDHLIGCPVLTKYLLDKFERVDDIVIVSPDVGSVVRAREFVENFVLPMAIIDKRRPKANECEIMNIIGDVKGRRVVIVEDMIDTGGTVVNASYALLDKGAKEVYVAFTHPVLSGPAISRLQQSEIKKLITLNTIELPVSKQIDKITQLSVAPIFAEAINRIHGNLSISSLFKDSSRY